MNTLDTVKSWFGVQRPAPDMVLRYFVPEKDFFSEETQSSYCAGMTYTIRPGNTKLAELAEKWFREGKIEFKEHRGGANIRGVS